MIDRLIKQINTDNAIVWKNIKMIFERELIKRNESIYDAFLYCWGRYNKGWGIEVQRAAAPEKKLLTAIYLYNLKETASFSLYREDIDEKVREDVKRLIIGVNETAAKQILSLEKVLDFAKLFTSARVF